MAVRQWAVWKLVFCGRHNVAISVIGKMRRQRTERKIVNVQTSKKACDHCIRSLVEFEVPRQRVADIPLTTK